MASRREPFKWKNARTLSFFLSLHPLCRCLCDSVSYAYERVYLWAYNQRRKSLENDSLNWNSMEMCVCLCENFVWWMVFFFFFVFVWEFILMKYKWYTIIKRNGSDRNSIYNIKTKSNGRNLQRRIQWWLEMKSHHNKSHEKLENRK